MSKWNFLNLKIFNFFRLKRCRWFQICYQIWDLRNLEINLTLHMASSSAAHSPSVASEELITCVMFSSITRRIALTESVLLGGMVNNITIDNRQLWCLGILIWTRCGAWKLGPITMINNHLSCFSLFLKCFLQRDITHEIACSVMVSRKT